MHSRVIIVFANRWCGHLAEEDPLDKRRPGNGVELLFAEHEA
jgi:hypothetical protein